MVDNVFQKSAGNETSDSVPHRGVLHPRDFDNDFTFVRYPAPDDLTAYVDYIWIIRWNFPDGVERQSSAILPNPQINLFFSSEEGAGIQGVYKTKKAYVASGKGVVAGVTFKPGGFFAFWPHDASQLTNKSRIVGTAFPKITIRYITDLLQQGDETICSGLKTLLRSKQVIADPNIALVQHILLHLEENKALQSVEAVAHAYSKSERSLQQLFKTYVGVGIKWVLLRNRLLSAADRARTTPHPDWATIASDLGYASQAHFITDFKRVTGMSPGSYLNMQ